MNRSTLAAPIVVSEFWKNRRGESIRVTLSTYAGRNLLDLRSWYTADDGRLKPGKGFCAEAKHLPRLPTSHGGPAMAVSKASGTR